MKVVIPVAGFGKRMRPHTLTRPKPLMSLAGNTAVGFILDKLEKMDVSEVIFITGHLKDKFEDYIKSNYKLNCRFIEQKEVNGTAGAVLLSEKYIDEPLMIVFVDTVFDADLSLIKKLKNDESGIIWVKEVEDYKRFGVCVTDSKSNYLSKIVEKPKEPISKLANIGLYYIKDWKLLFKGIHNVFESNKVVGGEYFLTDAFSYMVQHGAKIICPEVKGWYDVGKLETALESNRYLLKANNTKKIKSKNSKIIQPVNIAPDVIIENSIIGPHVAIESGCHVKNSIVQDSIICKNTKLFGVDLDYSIVGENCELIGKRKSPGLPKKRSFRRFNMGDYGTFTEN